MTYNVGLNVIEIDGSATPAIVGAATGTAAFAVRTQRGPVGSPRRVTSFTAFEEAFGAFEADSLGAFLVKGFFDNGGQTAWVTRIAGAASTAGSASLGDATLTAGFRGAPSPGPGSAAIGVTAASRVFNRAETLAAIKGTSNVAPGTGLAPLLVTVNGVAVSIPLPDSTTSQALVDAINTTGPITATLAANKVTITAPPAAAGATSSLEVTTKNDALGLPAASATGAPAAVAQNGTVLSGALPQVGTVLFVSGNAKNAEVTVSSTDPASGAVTWTPNLPVGLTDATLTADAFSLSVTFAGAVVESWDGLSQNPAAPQYAPAVLNHPLRGSRWIMLTSSSTASAAPLSGSAALGAGTVAAPTASDYLGDPAAKTGLHALDPYDVQLVATDLDTLDIAVGALAYCEGRGDCMYVGTVQDGDASELEAAIAYGARLQGAKVYGALYAPWITVLDPAGAGAAPHRSIPPTGHVMGVCARIAGARGIWKAPAGDEARLLGALDVGMRLSDTDHTALVREGSVNGIRAIPGAGIVVDASRTLSTDTRWLYVGTRLLFNYVEASLLRGLRWTRQEPNRDTLWGAVVHGSVTPFLMGLWRQGAFGTGTPAEVFTVVCDATNNPPDQVDQGILKVEVSFYPSRPAETIVIIVGQQPSGASVAEA
jgi:phage tail sheath protein FI